MTYEVRFQAAARDDLESIEAFIETDNPDAAKGVKRRLILRAESLSRFPLRGKVIPNSGEARYLVEANYLIIYDIHEADRLIMILRFWHSARDLNRFER